jgi:UDP-glucose 4-epimerase
MNKNILITGGCGFIGSNLASYFLDEGHKVFIIDDLSVGKLSNLKKHKNLTFIKGSIQKILNLRINQKFNVCIHLAAKAEILINKEKENKYFDDNVVGLQNVLKFCAQRKVEKFIFASSASVYGDTKNLNVNENFRLQPLHYYAYSKFLGEKMVENYGRINNFKYYILRFFNVYGPNSNAVVARFLSQYLQKKKITIYGNGKQSRDFIYIKDIYQAIKKIINKKIQSDIFNLGSSKSLKIKELKNLISTNAKYVNLDKRFDDIEISIADIKKANKILKWKPKISFQKGLNEMKKESYQRLLKFKLESINQQKKLISKFNKKS